MKISQHPLYRITVACALFASILLLLRLASTLLKPEMLAADDFPQYWAAGRLAGMGENSYSPMRITQLKEQLGLNTEQMVVAIMWTPPWTLALVIPFGILDYIHARIIYLLINIAILLYCANLGWQLYGGTKEKRWIAWILMFTFGPTISVLEKGQVTPFILLGVLLFLSYSERPKYAWLAGVFAALISVKPQLFYLFWITFPVWIILKRKWFVFLSFSLTLILATGIALVFNPHVIQQYVHAILYETPSAWATPTIGGYLRLFFGIDRFWLQFIPMLIGLIWLFIYGCKHLKTWNWIEAFPLLIMSSILTTAYAWTYDQVIMILAIFPAFILLIKKRWNWTTMLLVIIYGVIQGMDVYLHRYFNEFWFIWLAPSLIIWYLSAMQVGMHSISKLGWSALRRVA